MQKRSICLLLASVITMTASAYAEPAPVFDVDNIQGQYDGAYEVDQDLPPPPPPGQESMFAPSRPSRHAQHEADSSDALPYEQRISRLERQIDYLKSNSGSSRMDSLQGEVQAMRGQLDLLQKKLDKMEGQQKTLYADLDGRLLELKQSGLQGSDSDTKTTSKKKITAAKKPKKKTASNTQPNVEEEQEIYQTAYTLIKEKKYNEAVNALHRMLAKYPSGQFASNAHYWLGELYGLMNKNDKALTEFTKVVKHYPDSPRVSDAQLKIGLIYASDSRWSEAKAAFKKVINRYPGTASSRLASDQLKQLRASGH